jgi:hypothetical protein
MRLSWKGTALVFVGSLVFVTFMLSMAMGAIEDPMFGARARAMLDSLQRTLDQGSTAEVARELRPLLDEIAREGGLMNRYMVINLFVALANPLLAVWLVGRRRSSARFVLWMTLAGLFFGISLTSTYLTMHRLVLPGGLQDPRLRGLLGLCLFASCLLNGLLVAGIALRLARPTPVKPPLTA